MIKLKPWHWSDTQSITICFTSYECKMIGIGLHILRWFDVTFQGTKINSLPFLTSPASDFSWIFFCSPVFVLHFVFCLLQASLSVCHLFVCPHQLRENLEESITQLQTQRLSRSNGVRSASASASTLHTSDLEACSGSGVEKQVSSYLNLIKLSFKALQHV